MTSNKKDSTVRLIYKPNPEHKRSRSTPHIRITTNQNSKVERLCHNTFQVSEPPLDTYEGKLKSLLRKFKRYNVVRSI